jgi:hypothetical protein
MDHYKAVCQIIYSVLRSLKPHARYTLFAVRNKLVVSLIMPHIIYGNVTFSTVDSASQRRLNVAFNPCLRYVHDISRREYSSHLILTIIGVSLATHLRIFLRFCILGTRVIFLRCFITLLRHVLEMLFLILIGLSPSAIHSLWWHVGCGILFHIGLKMSALFFFWDSLRSRSLLLFFAGFLLLFLTTLGWISLDRGRSSTCRQIVTDLT